MGLVLLSCKEHRKLLPKKILTANDFKALTLLTIFPDRCFCMQQAKNAVYFINTDDYGLHWSSFE